MTLPSSGAITMAQVATELGVSQTGINLNQSNVRTLAGKPSGTISMSDLRGKSNGGASISIGAYNDGYSQYYGYGTSEFASSPFGTMTPNNKLTAAPGVAMRAFNWSNLLYTMYLIVVQASGSSAPFTPNAAYDLIVAGVTYRGTANPEGTSLSALISSAQFNAMPKSGTVAVNAIKV